MFAALNQARQSCGFTALEENTLLDKASDNHAQYMGVNNAGGDTESTSNADFTCATYVARAAAVGFPASTFGAGVSAVEYSVSASTNTQYGQALISEWLGGAYHGPAVLVPSGVVGIGTYQTSYNGYPEVRASISLLNTTLGHISSNAPLTYACQGSTGVLYSVVGEQPAPPNTSGSFGTPIAVVGNPSDTIVLQSGTLTDSSGHAVSLQLLDSADDPNEILAPYMASAYPTAPLTAGTSYTASITGIDNGTAFTRTFSFTTAIN
ncbi:spore germination YkwD domain-containing protein [Paraburkholderia elongata]|nr:CAP domain-containing protein [Paraburkholderia elongata]